MGGPREKIGTCDQEAGFDQTPSVPVPGPWTSRSVSNTFLLFRSYLVYGIFVIAAQKEEENCLPKLEDNAKFG